MLRYAILKNDLSKYRKFRTEEGKFRRWEIGIVVDKDPSHYFKNSYIRLRLGFQPGFFDIFEKPEPGDIASLER